VPKWCVGRTLPVGLNLMAVGLGVVYLLKVIKF